MFLLAVSLILLSSLEWLSTLIFLGFPAGSDSKETSCHVVDLGWIPGLGRYPEEGNSYPRQYSCLENSVDRASWQATVHGVEKSWTWLNVMTEWYLLSCSLSQGIFPIQGSNPGLLHCGWILYYLSYREALISPKSVPYSIIPQWRNMKFVFALYLF